MPARDVYHEAVKRALIKDGWTITHDPYTLSFGQRDVYVDLGAERVIAAEKDEAKIAVEIKSFVGPSEIRELEVALGQFVFYRSLLARVEPERTLFLAVPSHVLYTTLQEAIARPVLDDLQVAIVAFDPLKEEIDEWTL